MFTDPKTGETNTAIWFELYHAVYSEITLDSSALPIDELRKHLARFWEHRKYISAQQAEELVASVLRDHYGGDVLRVTANVNAPDGGIDLLIVSDGGLVRRAVQVKRRISQDVEPVEDVRNFIGAMLLSGNDNGVFVTTATRFSRGAATTATNVKLARKRLNVELIDGEQILELLEFSNLQASVKLPPLVDLDQEWTSDDGMRVNARRLLFSDLSRLFLK
jgi:restriction system protein